MKGLLYTLPTVADAVELVAKKVGSEKRTAKPRFIVFSPEKLTLLLESAISDEIGGFFHTRVFSFGKFLKYYKTAERVLSKEASVMLVRKILGETEDLKVFSKKSAGISANLYDSIALLKSAKITPSDVEYAAARQSGILKDKLSDLQTVYEKYEASLSSRLYDANSMLACIPDLICALPEIGDLDVFLVGYDGWTAQARTVVETLLKVAKSVHVVAVDGENEGVYTGEIPNAFKKLCENVGAPLEKVDVPVRLFPEQQAILSGLYNGGSAEEIKSDKMSLTVYDDVSSEVEAVARTIRLAVMKEGIRYRDLRVATPDTEKYEDAVARIFPEYGVPYYLDGKRNFSSHPLSSLVLGYFYAIYKNFRTEEVLALVKNPLFYGDKGVTDRFENYVLEKNVRFNGFLKPFEDADEDVENLRKRLEKTYRAFNKTERADVFCTALEAFLTEFSVKERLSALEETLKKTEPVEAEFSAKAYDVLSAVLSEIREIVGGSELEITEFCSVLKNGFTATEISILPQGSDSVYVGGYRDVGGVRSKRLFFVGLSGEVPEIKQDVAVLNDREIAALSDMKVMIDPTVKVVNGRAREEFATAMCTFTEKLYLSAVLSGRDGKALAPSDALLYLKRIFGFGDVKPASRLTKTSDVADDYLFPLQAEKTFAREIGKKKERPSFDFSGAEAYYFATRESGNAAAVLEAASAEITKELKTGKNITVKNTVPATTLESFFSCPFKCFMEKGLKLEERKTGEVKPKDAGEFIHRYSESFSRAFRQGELKTEADVDGFTETFVKETKQLPDYRRFSDDLSAADTLERLSEEAKRLGKKLYKQLKNTAFTVEGEEVPFGFSTPDCKYPPITLNTSEGDVFVRGRVDRLDRAGKDFRVIDYKTGAASDDDGDLYVGKKLQLYLYLNAFTGDGSRPVGTYYFKENDSYGGDGETQFLGRTLFDEDVIRKSDTSLCSGKSEILPVTVKADGTLKKDARLCTEQEMRARLSYAKDLAAVGAGLIKRGVVTATPLVKGISTPCSGCPYGGVCGFYAENGASAREALSANAETFVNAEQKGSESEKDTKEETTV